MRTMVKIASKDTLALYQEKLFSDEKGVSVIYIKHSKPSCHFVLLHSAGMQLLSLTTQNWRHCGHFNQI